MHQAVLDTPPPRGTPRRYGPDKSDMIDMFLLSGGLEAVSLEWVIDRFEQVGGQV